MEEPQLISFLKSEGEVMVEQPEHDMVASFCTGLAEEITQDGTHHLVAQYGGLLNIFKKIQSINIAVVKAALECISVALKVLTTEMKENDGKVSEFSKERKRYLRKSLVVAAFLTYKSFNELENQIHTDKQNVTITSADQVIKRSRGKKNKPIQEDKGKYTFWNSSRVQMTTSIVEMLSCSWEHLWQDRNTNGLIYMRCFTIAYCNILKYRGEEMTANDEHAGDIFQILGMLAFRAHEEKTIVGRLMPLVKNGEAMGKLISSCIVYIEDNFDKTQMIQTAIIEGNKVYFGQLQSEVQIERGFSTFIMELSSSNPQQLVKALPNLLPFLESESSTVRSAVLTASVDILSWDKKRSDEIRAVGTDTLRDEVLELTILAHIKDSNANVRSKVLQLMIKLISNKDLHEPEIVSCMRVGIKRLMDKGVSVRKQAILLMIALVNNNPFIVKFTRAHFHEDIRKHRLLLHDMIAADTKNKFQLMEIILEEFLTEEISHDILMEKFKRTINDTKHGIKIIEEYVEKLSFWEAFEVFGFLLVEFSSDPNMRNIAAAVDLFDRKTIYFQYFTKVLEEKFPGEEAPDLNNSQHFESLVESELINKKKLYITYLKCSEEMCEMMENVLNIMAIILDKGDPGDKHEVVNFFSEIAIHGYKPSCKLTVSVVDALSQYKDKDIDDQTLNQFCVLFLDDPRINLSNRGARSNVIFIKNLMNVVGILPVSQKESINRLVLQLRQKNILDNDCIKLLWDAFTLSAGEWNANDSSNAVYLLGVIGEEENCIITTNIQQLMSVGFGPRGLNDFKLVKSTCEALLFVSKKKKQQEDDDYQDTLRFPVSHVMFEQITAIIEKGLKDKGNDIMDEYYGVVAELAVQLIYKLAMDPKVIIRNLVSNLHHWVFGEGDNSSQIKDTERLAMRYLSLCTALLGCHILYYETTVTSYVKKRRTEIQKHQIKVDKNKNKNSKQKRRTTRTNSSAASDISRSSCVSNETVDNTETNELDQIVGAGGHDADLDVIKNHVESLLESGFYRQFRVQTILYCNKINGFQSLRLKVACVKAMAKIMSVNADLVVRCAESFKRLWDSCNHPIVRVEMIRAAIRLNYRFPNQMEKCNDLINAGLQDKHPSVRKASLDFITYLMLSDLLKARSQLTEASILTCDADEDVQDMARDFLRQCADKDNILSNAIPDIFSRLNDRHDVSQDMFKSIVKYLLKEIKKEKQILGLVEKMVSRFREIKDNDNEVKKYQNAAFCLTQLPINEKSFKIIKDNFTAYSDKLDDDFIHSSFSEILKEARKSFKAEAKARLDEFEKELLEMREKCVEMKRIEDAAAGRGPPSPNIASSDSDESEGNEEALVEEDQSNSKTEHSTSEQLVSDVESEGIPFGQKVKESESDSTDSENVPEKNHVSRSAKKRQIKKTRVESDKDSSSSDMGVESDKDSGSDKGVESDKDSSSDMEVDEED